MYVLAELELVEAVQSHDESEVKRQSALGTMTMKSFPY